LTDDLREVWDDEHGVTFPPSFADGHERAHYKSIKNHIFSPRDPFPLATEIRVKSRGSMHSLAPSKPFHQLLPNLESEFEVGV